ncbi:MAG: S41 family peptidase [Candidatus Magasanikbacteria bacterium]|nr:S41 family peptidase [Candidatus Magasanikbacteria bacterium]
MSYPSPAVERSQSIMRRYSYTLLVVAVFIAGLFVGRTSIGVNVSASNVSSSTSTSTAMNRETPSYVSNDADFNQFWNVWQMVQQKYVKRPADEKQMVYGAISGMVASLGDPYSVYFVPEVAKQFQEELDGSFSGIGAEIALKDGKVVVVAPLPDSPAEAAGLLPGDAIIEIDGHSTASYAVEQAVKEIRGKEGTKVKLKLQRAKVSAPIVVEIERKTIQLKSVTSQLIGDNASTELITITSFNDQTIPQFNDAVGVAQKNKVKNIVLDLRNDPGGYFDGAIAVASEWLKTDDVVVAEREAAGAPTRQEFKTNGDHRLGGIPTVVLINSGSASASEIVAGALQDYGVAKLIGSKSFGKGSVQEYQTLDDGSALKLTVALWFTPKDRSINEQGIKPDIAVPEPVPGKDAPDAILAARKDVTKDTAIQRALLFLKSGK